MTAPARSYLYVPGHRPDRFARAMASGADAVIFDLEDAVAVEAKDGARAAVAAHLDELATPAAAPWVRINQGPRGRDDLAAVAGRPALAGVVVPKATPEVLAAVGEAAGLVALMGLVESAVGIQHAGEVAAAGAAILALGEVDLHADLRLAPTVGDAAAWPLRMAVVVASAAAGLAAPVGPVPLEVRDPEGLARTTAALRDAGFGSRAAIHPAQVPIINEVFTPTVEAEERARRLLDLAAASGGGACVDDDGRLVDEAVLRTARHTLDLAAAHRR